MNAATSPRKAHGAPSARRLTRPATLVVALVLALVVVAVSCGGPTVQKALTPEHCTARSEHGEITLSVDQAEVATTIVAVAIRRELPRRAVTIAMATAEQESKLQNLDHGDRDSVGVFQQRPSQGWGTNEELQDTAYAANKFFAALEKVEGYEDMPLHEAAQRVQRSAYGPAYADHEPKAEVLSTALTGRTGTSGFTCVLRPTGKGTSVRNMRAAVHHDWGERTVRRAQNGFAVRMGESAPTRHATAMSFWVVARANTFGIRSVRYAGKQWRAKTEDEVWYETETPDPPGRIAGAWLPKPTPSSS